MDSFLSKFFPAVYEKETSTDPSNNQYCKFDSQILTLFTSSLYLAALVSSLVAATVSRKCGRRITMLMGGILFLAGALLNGFAQTVSMLIAGRLLLGFGIGCANQVSNITLLLAKIKLYSNWMIVIPNNILILFCSRCQFIYPKWRLINTEDLSTISFNS